MLRIWIGRGSNLVSVETANDLVYEQDILERHISIWVQSVTCWVQGIIEGAKTEVPITLLRLVYHFEQAVRSCNYKIGPSVVDVGKRCYLAHEDNISWAILWVHALAIDGETHAALQGWDAYILHYLILFTFEADAITGTDPNVDYRLAVLWVSHTDTENVLVQQLRYLKQITLLKISGI